MAFNATLEATNGIAKINLKGELDAVVHPFQEQVEKAAQANVKHLVLMQDLVYGECGSTRVDFQQAKDGA